MKPLRPLQVASTIAQMRREFGITARALRYYEQPGLLSPDRSRPARVYSHRDRVRLKLILKGQQAGLALREIRDLLDVYDRDGKPAQMASVELAGAAQLSEANVVSGPKKLPIRYEFACGAVCVRGLA